ncbi:MAG: dockerin type I repeat-containing protein [Ruminococcus sp.]|nr:dockerin type I repeat-containing protein [Ruminococcus sp.]
MKKRMHFLSVLLSCTLLLNLLGLFPTVSVHAETAETEQVTLLGDANSDGSFTIMDVVLLQKYLLGLETETFTWPNADFDGNQRINVFDSVLMKNALVEQILEQFCGAAGYITREFTTVETEHITFEIDENIYVRNDLALHADRIYEAIEAVTGLSYTDAPYGERLVINVSRPDTDSESEIGAAHAGHEVYFSSGDLLIADTMTIIHESVHVLEERNDEYFAGQTLTEGFATYTTALVTDYLEEHYPDTYAIGGTTVGNNSNYNINEDIYTQPLEYWIENGYPSAGNGLYGVGRLILAYLHATQGDFTSWIPARDALGYFESTFIENEDGTTTYVDGFTPEKQIQLIESVYGEGILDGCYDWLKEHESDFFFNVDLSKLYVRDLTEVEHLDLYPYFTGLGNETTLLDSNIPVAYSDLEIDLEPTRFYLEKYKHYDTSEMYLNIDESCQLALYDENGELLRECTGGEGVSLENVYKIRLVGEGTVTRFEITNYVPMEKPGYITQEFTIVETEHITFEIDENIYVRNDLALHADRIYEAIEAVTGLSYTDAPHGKRLVIKVSRPDTDSESEVGIGASASDMVYLLSGDLLIDDNYHFIHEMAHVLENRNDEYFAGKTLTEGFAVYVTSLALDYLEEHYPDTCAIGWMSIENDHNHNVEEDIYTQPLEYWIENGYPSGFNGLYGVGNVLLSYLHATQGDFTSWIPARDALGNFEGTFIENEDGTATYIDGFTPEKQIQLIESVYGEGILDGCYDWLKEHESDFIFESSWNESLVRDLTEVEHFDLYPEFNALGNETTLLSDNIPVAYSTGLEIDLAPTRQYLEEYKGYDTSEMYLNIDEDCTVYFYNISGQVIGASVGGENISLEGVYKIQLMGSGTITKFEITNYVKAE